MPSITTNDSSEPARMAGAISGKVTVKMVVKAERRKPQRPPQAGSMLRSARR
jgi:hypothetical protein